MSSVAPTTTTAATTAAAAASCNNGSKLQQQQQHQQQQLQWKRQHRWQWPDKRGKSIRKIQSEAHKTLTGFSDWGWYGIAIAIGIGIGISMSSLESGGLHSCLNCSRQTVAENVSTSSLCWQPPLTRSLVGCWQKRITNRGDCVVLCCVVAGMLLLRTESWPNNLIFQAQAATAMTTASGHSKSKSNSGQSKAKATKCIAEIQNKRNGKKKLG